MIKALTKLGIEGMYLKFIRVYMTNLKQHHIQWGKTELISSKVSNETRMPALPNLIQHIPEILSQSNKAREEVK
jgi:hypothetical protein